MWIFTRYGFYSIASARLKNGQIAPDQMMVRARQRRHLENLIARFPTLGESEIKISDANDYRYRIFVAKSVWTKIVDELAEEQNWSNFKGETERFLGRHFDDYVRALHRVWSVMHNLQQQEPVSLNPEMRSLPKNS